MTDVIKLAEQLINCPSITPDDAGCQNILQVRLKKLDFKIEEMPFGEVKNFWARRGTQGPLFVFAGHTDVVPPGPLEQWQTPPFEANIRNDFLYGRGAADMKGGIAAMMIACENFMAKHPDHQGSIAWLITSDEEGPSIDGTAKVVEKLKQRGEKPEWCLVGEATCEQQLGDIIKIGRRGTLSGKLIIYGKQGHIAYPQIAMNPIHKFSSALNELTNIQWDSGNEFFQPTSLQFSNINSGTGAGNVIPGELHAQFNFRYSPLVTAEELQERLEMILKKYELNYSLTWQHSGKPFLTPRGELAELAAKAVAEITGVTPIFSTSGGTSDGRFIAELGTQIIELGPRNKTIHQINECVAVSDLVELSKIYERLLELLFNR